jgi:SAM-dependent methyltransferase
VTASNTYTFNNAWTNERARLDALEALTDPGTTRHLAALGVGPGWACLEVGGGGGSITRWLAERVAPGGRVVVTDVNTKHLEPLQGEIVEVRQHNIAQDELEENAFDLAFARLVLEHIPEREAVLAKMVQSLKPGGWLFLESTDSMSVIPISQFGHDLHEKSQSIRLAEFRSGGLDTYFGRKMPAAMRAVGLVDIGNEGRVWVMEAGSPGAEWLRLSMDQVRARLVGPGKLSEGELDEELRNLTHSDFQAYSPIIMAAWGRRPVFDQQPPT